MKRSVVAAIVPLIASFGIVLIPAVPASAATPVCGGTSLAAGGGGLTIRVPTVSNAHPNEFDCDLGPGSPSVPVMRLQIDLNDCYHDNLSVDGSYGPATMTAVKNAQAADGQPASQQDGLYGPLTIDGGTLGSFPGPFSYATERALLCDSLVNP